jgi:hypothetical protein
MHHKNEGIVDAEGTTQEDAMGIIASLRDDVFSGDAAKTAIALGLTDEQFTAVINGETPVDDDLAMKARGIAQQRGGNSDETGMGKTA